MLIELMVLVEDVTNPDDPDKDRQLPKRGDVIDWKPAGFAWSASERTDPRRRFVTVDVTTVEADDLLLGDFGDPLLNRFPRWRSAGLDFSRHPDPAVRAKFDRGGRPAPKATDKGPHGPPVENVALSLAEFRAMKRVKDPSPGAP